MSGGYITLKAKSRTEAEEKFDDLSSQDLLDALEDISYEIVEISSS